MTLLTSIIQDTAVIILIPILKYIKIPLNHSFNNSTEDNFHNNLPISCTLYNNNQNI